MFQNFRRAVVWLGFIPWKKFWAFEVIGPSAVKGKIAVRLSPGKTWDIWRWCQFALIPASWNCTKRSHTRFRQLHWRLEHLALPDLQDGGMGNLLVLGWQPIEKSHVRSFFSTKSRERWEVMRRLWKEDVSSPWCFSEGHKGAGMTLAVARKHGKPPGLQWCHAGENSRFCSWWSGTSTAGCYHDATKSWIIQTRAVGTDDTVMGRVGSTIPHFSWCLFWQRLHKIKRILLYGTGFYATGRRNLWRLLFCLAKASRR